MENQHVIDPYYYKLPAQHQQHRRENPGCYDDLTRASNMIPSSPPGYPSQVKK